MSKPEPGDYFICNKVLSPSGQKLAITFRSQGAIATIISLDVDLGRKQWTIKDSGDGTTQTISPAGNEHLQAAWGADGVSVLPAKNYVWNIRNTDNGYTLQNGSTATNWGVAEADNYEKVTLSSDTGDDKQRWIFIRC